MGSLPSSNVPLKVGAMTFSLFMFAGLAVFQLSNAGAQTASGQSAAAAACVAITDPREIPGPKIITFDELKDNTALTTQYKAPYGVEFLNQNPSAVIHTVTARELDTPQTPPNVAQNPLLPGVKHSALTLSFSFPRTHVGFFLGNGGTLPTGGSVTAFITAYDAAGNRLCALQIGSVSAAHTTFAGMYDSAGQMASVTIDYGGNTAESIDNLYLAPGANYGGRKPLPTWTAIPSLTPTQGPPPTATPQVPAFPVYAYAIPANLRVPALFPPDFGIFNIELTQGIQCFNGQPAGCADNSLPFVLSKSTVARVYIQARDSHSFYHNVPVRLHLLAFGHEYILNALGNATGSINQNQHDAAEFYFTAYSGATSDVGVWAEVDPDHLYAASYLQSRYPAVGYNLYTFANRRTISVAGERLYYHPAGYSGSQYAGGWAVNGGAAQWWNQILPVSDNGISYFVRSGYLDWTSNLSSADAQHSLIGVLNFMWVQENAFAWWFGSGPFTGVRHVYGWAPAQGYSGGHADMPIYPHAGGLGVVGIGSDAPGTDTDNPGSGALIFAHELTHDYNVYHTNTPDACGSNDSNSNFPYATSSIQSFGFNTITGKIYNPASTQDLMSYCPSGGSKLGWISPFTWNEMFGHLTTASAGLAAPGGFQAQAIPTQSLVVHAIIDHPTISNPTVYTGHLGTLYRVNNTGPMPQIVTGTFAVEEHAAAGGGGSVLYSQSFVVDFTSEYSAPVTLPPSPFPATDTSAEEVAFIVPWMEGTRSLVLVHQGPTPEVLDMRNVPLNAPQVTITSPIQPVDWPAHTVQPLSWAGTDLDGLPLAYSVFFSNDGGLSFRLLASGLTTTTYQVEVDAMAGGADVRFRVVASDGVNTGFDETPATITLPIQPPVAIITDPLSATFHSPGDLIVFHGLGTDLQDGTLPAGALEWSDNRQGSLGIGPTLPINNLTPGDHLITLTVSNSYNISSKASISIQIAYPVYFPSVVR